MFKGILFLSWNGHTGLQKNFGTSFNSIGVPVQWEACCHRSTVPLQGWWGCRLAEAHFEDTMQNQPCHFLTPVSPWDWNQQCYSPTSVPTFSCPRTSARETCIGHAGPQHMGVEYQSCPEEWKSFLGAAWLSKCMTVWNNLMSPNWGGHLSG